MAHETRDGSFPRPSADDFFQRVLFFGLYLDELGDRLTKSRIETFFELRHEHMSHPGTCLVLDIGVRRIFPERNTPILRLLQDLGTTDLQQRSHKIRSA